MNKQETQIMKGIALLMMIIVHVDMSNSLQVLHVGDIIFFDVIKAGCSPVAFFIMLSGYGLMYVYKNGDRHHYGRILKLFIHFWMILLIFVPLGAILVGTDVYPGNLEKVIENVTSFHTSYNYECWFLFPFVIISLSYPLTLKLFDRMGGALLFLSCVFFFASGFVISHYHLIYKTAPYLLYNVLQVPFLLFSFLIGASLFKWHIPERMSNYTSQNARTKLIFVVAILALLVYGMLVHTTAFWPFTAVLMFLSLLMMVKGHECRSLQLIGKHSMNMWMAHTFFLHYLFHDMIYSLRYTILIIAATLLLSLICSMTINWVASKIDNKIYELQI